MDNKSAFWITLTWIAVGASSRLLPHPPNVTPLAAMALLGGAYLGGRQALIFPLLALFASDLFLGLHGTIPFVYLPFLLTALLGRRLLSSDRGAGRVLSASLAGSILFFAVSNLGTWWTQELYPHDFPGLAACYAAAVPFLRNSVLGDLFFTGLLFGLERASLHLLPQRSGVSVAQGAV